jgi:hypothetical protein
VAKKPDGSSAGTQRVTFTKGAAERIGKVVREVEAGNRDLGPLTFGPRVGTSGKVFRVCTFTGAWSINASKTVTFKNQTSTPNTVSAVNLFYDLPSSGTSDCAIAKDGTAWYLVQDVHTTMTVITGATLTTAGLQFTRAVINVVATATASVQTVGTTAC